MKLKLCALTVFIQDVAVLECHAAPFHQVTLKRRMVTGVDRMDSLQRHTDHCYHDLKTA